MGVTIQRLTEDDLGTARSVFALMSEVFGEDPESLSDEYLTRLLACKEFVALAAYSEVGAVAGLTAHLIPMTRTETTEIFIYTTSPCPGHIKGKVSAAV